jgi:hypothetical protein
MLMLMMQLAPVAEVTAEEIGNALNDWTTMSGHETKKLQLASQIYNYIMVTNPLVFYT